MTGPVAGDEQSSRPDWLDQLGAPHLPGRNGRPPEDGPIGRLHDDAASADESRKSRAFAAAMLLLAHGYYWEVHEVLEPLWMAEPPNGARREGLQGLIQFTNGALKVRMGRFGAATRLFAIARQHLMSAGAGCGFDPRAAAALIAEAEPGSTLSTDAVARKIARLSAL